MSFLSSFTLLPTLSGASESAFEKYNSMNPTSMHTGSTGTGTGASTSIRHHQGFIPIENNDKNSNGIFAGTMLQDRPKRPASYRYELGSISHPIPSQPLQQPQQRQQYEDVENDDDEPRQSSISATAHIDYKTQLLQKEIRIQEQQKQISILREETRQLQCTVMTIQAHISRQNTADNIIASNGKDRNPSAAAKRLLPQTLQNDDHRQDDNTVHDTRDAPPMDMISFSTNHVLSAQKQFPIQEDQEQENVYVRHGSSKSSSIRDTTKPSRRQRPSWEEQRLECTSYSTLAKKLAKTARKVENAQNTPVSLCQLTRHRRRHHNDMEPSGITTPPGSPPLVDGLTRAMEQSVLQSCSTTQTQGTLSQKSLVLGNDWNSPHHDCFLIAIHGHEGTTTEQMKSLQQQEEPMVNAHACGTTTSNSRYGRHARTKRIRTGFLSTYTCHTPAIKKKRQKGT